MRKLRIKINKNEYIISCFLLLFIVFIIMLDVKDVIYYYSKMKYGTQFEAPLLGVELSDGYYFIVKNNDKRQYVFSHRTNELQFIIDADRKINFKLWEQKKYLKYLDKKGTCTYYKMVQSNNNFMVIIRGKIFITYTLSDNNIVNWNNVCASIFFKT